MIFADLRLSKPILDAVAEEGYVHPTPIQAQTIPSVMEGRDVLGSAQTGTGKTAAFALPVLHRLTASLGHTAGKSGRNPGGNPGSNPEAGVGGKVGARCLVLCPTRELAGQIGASFSTYGKHLKLKQVVIFGGVNQNPQVRALRQGAQIIIATPGRLLDLMNQGHVDLSQVDTLVLDEADRMLDMGFIHDINRVVRALPAKRQTLLFSATMPPAIRKLASKLLTEPVMVDVSPRMPVVEAIEQSVYFVPQKQKPELLTELLGEWSITRALVFTRTKHGADRVVKHLLKQEIAAEAIHGNKTQNARERALKRFRGGQTHILVATDIASRGIDVEGISHVVNFDMTHEPETHVHRIGRTARAGATGRAVSFCSRDERGHLRAIERMLGKAITIATDRPAYAEAAQAEPAAPGKSSASRGGGGGGGGKRSSAGGQDGMSRGMKRKSPSRPRQARGASGARGGSERTATSGGRPRRRGGGQGGKTRQA